MTHHQSTLQKLFLDKHGKLVLMQKPNVPIIIWAVCAIGGHLTDKKPLTTTLVAVGTGALLTWAILEIGWGVNYFRRLLGSFVLIWTIIHIFW